MKATATLTSKGQVTVPLLVRQELGLNAGDTIEFDCERGKAVVRPVRGKLSSFGILKDKLPKGWKAPTVEEMDAGIAQHCREKFGRR